MIKSLFVSLFILTNLTTFSQSAELMFGHRYYEPFNPTNMGYEGQYQVGLLFNSPIEKDSRWIMQTQADISIKDQVEITDKGLFERNRFSASILFGRLLTSPKRSFGLTCFFGTSTGWRGIENADYRIRRSHIIGLLSVQPSYTLGRLIMRLQITPEWSLLQKDMSNNRAIDPYFNRVPTGSGTNINSQISVGWIFKDKPLHLELPHCKMNNPIDHYISEFPKEVQFRLRELQALIRKLTPESKEVMTYGIPTFVLSENLVHFAGYKNHIGFYPGSSAIAHFSKEISKYKNAKGSVQFPLTEPTPLKLIERMVKFRLNAVAEKDKLKLEKERLTKPFAGTDLAVLPAPAQRALHGAGLTTLKKIAAKKPEELLALHGFGKSALPLIHSLLQKKAP